MLKISAYTHHLGTRRQSHRLETSGGGAAGYGGNRAEHPYGVIRADSRSSGVINLGRTWYGEMIYLAYVQVAQPSGIVRVDVVYGVLVISTRVALCIRGCQG